MSNFDEDVDAPLARERGNTTYQQRPVRPQQRGYDPGYGYGAQWGTRPRRQFPIETKPFFLTSEFAASLLAVAGIAITAMSSDSFGAWRAWVLITAVTVAYLLSRGIAKSGTRSNAVDPREELDWCRHDQHDGRS